MARLQRVAQATLRTLAMNRMKRLEADLSAGGGERVGPPSTTYVGPSMRTHEGQRSEDSLNSAHDSKIKGWGLSWPWPHSRVAKGDAQRAVGGSEPTFGQSEANHRQDVLERHSVTQNVHKTIHTAQQVEPNGK